MTSKTRVPFDSKFIASRNDSCDFFKILQTKLRRYKLMFALRPLCSVPASTRGPPLDDPSTAVPLVSGHLVGLYGASIGLWDIYEVDVMPTHAVMSCIQQSRHRGTPSPLGEDDVMYISLSDKTCRRFIPKKSHKNQPIKIN